MNLIIRVSEICCVHLFIFTNPFDFLETRCFLFCCCLLSSVSPCECKQHMVAPSQASSTHTCACQIYTHTPPSLVTAFTVVSLWLWQTGLQTQSNFHHEFQRTFHVTLQLWVNCFGSYTFAFCSVLLWAASRLRKDLYLTVTVASWLKLTIMLPATWFLL